ncbi:MAG: hypothetical protein Ct9H300mP28_09660 [Pseudomonadota bacterium]|nr:MAG: hypothetical protein Ct9H300mP28_09660 [Pseudomonadota bacterium]
MSSYQEWLAEELKQNENWVYPGRYRNELIQLLKDPLQDLCISRPKSRLKWGVEMPFDNNFVTYVWFDALLNYASALDWPDGENSKNSGRMFTIPLEKIFLKHMEYTGPAC